MFKQSTYEQLNLSINSFCNAGEEGTNPPLLLSLEQLPHHPKETCLEVSQSIQQHISPQQQIQQESLDVFEIGIEDGATEDNISINTSGIKFECTNDNKTEVIYPTSPTNVQCSNDSNNPSAHDQEQMLSNDTQLQSVASLLDILSDGKPDRSIDQGDCEADAAPPEDESPNMTQNEGQSKSFRQLRMKMEDETEGTG